LCGGGSVRGWRRNSYSGGPRGIPTIDFPDGPNVYAEEIKNASGATVVAVGKLGNPEAAERVIRERKADLIALGRLPITDGRWAQKVQEGRWNEILHC
jgi:2,4-dienoyl-CoA reductase-like NADH-dependent reductase (Old Yellow Enzyme family)